MTRWVMPLICLWVQGTLVWGGEARSVSTARRDALVAALLHWPDETAQDAARARPSLHIRTLRTLATTMAREGGYAPSAMLDALAIRDESQVRIARAFRQLDRLHGVTHPGNSEPTPGRPNALLCAAVVAFAYSPPDADGERAVTHLAELCDDDLAAAATGRVMYHLIAGVLASPSVGRRQHVRLAAQGADAEGVARRVRGARTMIWKRFPPLKDNTSALERIVRIWLLANTVKEARNLADAHLPSPSARQALACLLAVSHGAEGVPQQSVWDAASDPETASLRATLITLDRRGIRLPVDLRSTGKSSTPRPPDSLVITEEHPEGEADSALGVDPAEADAFMAALEKESLPDAKDKKARLSRRRGASRGAVPFLQLLPRSTKAAKKEPTAQVAASYRPELPDAPELPERPGQLEPKREDEATPLSPR